MSMSKKILIKNGTVVTAESIARRDVLISGDKIEAVGELSDVKVDEVISADGLLVMPGGIDPHVHFNDHFMETVSVHDFFSGTLAAAYGGITSVVDFANQCPGESLISTLENKKAEARDHALVDWGIHPVITSPDKKTISEIPTMVKMGAPTIKCYMTYRDEGLMINDGDLKTILVTLKKNGGMLMVHAEDNKIIEAETKRTLNEEKFDSIFHARTRPLESEDRAIHRCVEMVRQYGGKLFVVHMSSGNGVDIIKRARRDGLGVFAETCTHYLVFTEGMLEREDGIKWICSPPLRTSVQREKMWVGLREGVVSLVSSDDAAYSWSAKLMGKDRFDRCPNGIPGVEVRLSLLFSEGVIKRQIPITRFVEWVSANPAKMFGLYPKKGTISPGTDADIILFDPNEMWVMNQETLHMASDWTAYSGIPVTGKIKKVFSRGELIIDEDRCLAQPGRGEYLHRHLSG